MTKLLDQKNFSNKPCPEIVRNKVFSYINKQHFAKKSIKLHALKYVLMASVVVLVIWGLFINNSSPEPWTQIVSHINSWESVLPPIQQIPAENKELIKATQKLAYNEVSTTLKEIDQFLAIIENDKEWDL